MKLCPYCKNEVSGHQIADDDWIDHCKECGIIVEGETIDSDDMEQEQQLQDTWNILDQDEQAIEEFCNGTI